MRLSLVLLIAFSCTIKAADEINTEVFDQLKDYILDDPATQGVLISKNNQIIFEEYADGYDQNDLGTTWSLAKTFYAALIGVAIEQGFDVSLDDPIKKYIPEFSNDDRGDVSLRNLLAMKSGFEITQYENQEMFFSLNNLEFALNVKKVAPAGEKYEYNNVNTMLLNPIIKSIFMKGAHEVLANEIFAPLGISHYGLWQDTEGNDMTYYGIDITPRDLMKFGQLIDNDGVWDGKQIIDQSFLAESIKPLSEGKGEWFGLHWSVRKFDQNKSLVGLEVTDGEMLYIIPEENLVFVRLTKYIHDSSKGYKVNFGPLAYLLWMPYSWVRAITEFLAPAPSDSDEEFVDDPNLNIPNTQAKGISIYHCPFTSPDECEGVTKIQNLIFGLSESSAN